MVIQHRDGILKLIDFGESLPLGTSGIDADRKGAHYYRSPRGGSTPHRDLYSLGVVLRDYMQDFKITDSFLSRFHSALTGRHGTVAEALAEFRPHFNDARFAQARQIWREILKEHLRP
jgi:serine/threonine protein kinase